MRPSRPVLLTVPLTLAIAVPAGAAAPSTPRSLPSLGTTTSPFAVTDGGRSIGLKRALHRSLPRRGASVGIACAEIPDPLRGTSSEVSTATTVRPRVRLSIPKGYDFCVVKVKVARKTRRGTTTSTPATGNVALNAAGAEYLQERELAALMSAATDLAIGATPGERAPSSARIAEALDGTRVLGRRLRAVSIPGPGTSVPPGTLGVFFDGTRTSVTATTQGGRRLHLDYDRSTQEVSTNVLRTLNDTTGDDQLSDIES